MTNPTLSLEPMSRYIYTYNVQGRFGDFGGLGRTYNLGHN